MYNRNFLQETFDEMTRKELEDSIRQHLGRALQAAADKDSAIKYIDMLEDRLIAASRELQRTKAHNEELRLQLAVHVLPPQPRGEWPPPEYVQQFRQMMEEDDDL